MNKNKVLQTHRELKEIIGKLNDINDDLAKTGRHLVALRKLELLVFELASNYTEDSIINETFMTLHKTLVYIIHEIEDEETFEAYMLGEKLKAKENDKDD